MKSVNVEVCRGELASKIDAWLLQNKFPRNGNVVSQQVGFQVAVYDEGELVLNKAYGCSRRAPLQDGKRQDGRQGTPMRVSHRNRFASNTKKFTGVMLSYYLRKMKIPLFTSIKDLCPGCDVPEEQGGLGWYENPHGFRAPTIWQTVCHRAGFRRDAYVLDHDPYDAATGLQYSNSGIRVAAMLLEAVAGKSAEEMWEEVFQPRKTGLNGLSLSGKSRFLDKRRHPLAYCYNRELLDDAYLWKEARTPNFKVSYSGSIRGTAEQVARCNMIFCDGGVYKGRQIVPRPVIDEVFRPMTFGYTNGYYGFMTGFRMLEAVNMVIPWHYHTGSLWAKSYTGFTRWPRRLAFAWVHTSPVDVWHDTMIKLITDNLTGAAYGE